MAGPSVKVRLDLVTSAFDRGLSNSLRKVRSFEKSLAGLAIRGAAATAAAISAGAVTFGAGIKSALDLGSALSDLRLRTGASVKELYLLQVAFKDAGVGAENTGPLINKMQDAISEAAKGTKEAVEAFSELNLDIVALRKLNAVQQFQKITDAIRKVSDATKRSDISKSIFGKGGGAILAVTADDMQNAALSIGSAGDILNRRAEKFDRASDILGHIPDKFRQFFVGVSDKLIDAISPVLEMFDRIDVAAFGQRVGDALKPIVTVVSNAIQSGHFGELIGLSVEFGLLKAVEAMTNGWKRMMAYITGEFDDFTAHLYDVFQAIGAFFGNALINAFKDSIVEFTSLFVKGITVALNRVTALMPKSVRRATGLSLLPEDDKTIQAAIRAALGSNEILTRKHMRETFKFTGYTPSGELKEVQNRLNKFFAEAWAMPSSLRGSSARSITPEGDGFGGVASRFKSDDFNDIRSMGGGYAGSGGADRAVDISQRQLTTLEAIRDLIKSQGFSKLQVVK